jgi:hypothetical protein
MAGIVFPPARRSAQPLAAFRQQGGVAGVGGAGGRDDGGALFRDGGEPPRPPLEGE